MRSRLGRITKLGFGMLGLGGAAGSAAAYAAVMWTMQDSDDQQEPFRRRVAYNPVTDGPKRATITMSVDSKSLYVQV
ncbi:unnamed protein product [Notodromas monacha]|uniref:Uncharacterized protein n=1 Tax=Notodromas monacha TaxID=399045 RepID=A0A7R9BFJ3_9CRUS|nr:unnamed protein product [Notodromas monacha]CAG0913718.1 unnamed protein product [Notodromas monacha]